MTDTQRLLTGSVLGLAAAVLAACGGTPAPQPVAAPPPPAPVPTDGSYDGLAQVIRGSANSCGDQMQFRLRVVNQAFSYRLAQPRAEWKPVIVFNATIGPDGSFNARSGTGFHARPGRRRPHAG